MKMDRLPLLFTFKDLVYGDGFLADIEAQGRALAERGPEEEGKVWITGVQPGGIAEGAESAREAYAKFRNTYKAVLFDVASEAKNFNAFKREVQNFFNEVCNPAEKEWWSAVERVRKEGYTQKGLHKKSAKNTEMKIIVKKVKSTPKYNTINAECHQLPEHALAA